jgi:hypothetical protein
VLDGKAPSVDSSVPPPPSPSRTHLRPWYLVAAMVLTWFVGVTGLSEGFGIAAFLRVGALPDLATATLHVASTADVQQLVRFETQRALLAHARITFPLAVAEAILSGLLVMVSGLAMGGRRGTRTLALQALAANAVLVIVAYLLTPAIRAASLDGLLRAVDTIALPPQQREFFSNRGIMTWAFRFKLVVVDLGGLALGALALTRARTKTYFEAEARAAEGPDEP